MLIGLYVAKVDAAFTVGTASLFSKQAVIYFTAKIKRCARKQNNNYYNLDIHRHKITNYIIETQQTIP